MGEIYKKIINLLHDIWVLEWGHNHLDCNAVIYTKIREARDTLALIKDI